MTPEMFRKLAALGLSHDQMAGVLEIFEDDAETRKAKARARVQKWRDKNKCETSRNVTEHHETSRNATVGLTRAVDKSSNSEIKDLGKEDKKAPAALVLRSELETVLDERRVDAVLEHRKGFKGKFTARAAHLLAAEFAKCPDPNAAADEMVRRNWQGFKAEWMNGHDPPGNRNKAPTAWERQAQAFEDLRNERDQQRPDKSLAGSVLSLPRTGTDGQ